MNRDSSPAVQALMERGRSVDAYLTAAGYQPPPGPWPAPTPEQVAEARRMQLDPPTRRVQ